jgi:hypothetical protein
LHSEKYAQVCETKYLSRGCSFSIAGSPVAEDVIIYTYIYISASVVQWSEFLATDPEARVRFLALPEKK